MNPSFISIVILSILFQHIKCHVIDGYEIDIDDCPNGWTQKNNNCFYFSNYATDWHQAREWCINHTAQLVVIEDDDKFDDILELTDSKLYFWIGLNDLDKRFTFYWENGKTIDQNHHWFYPGQFDRSKAIVNGCVYVDTIDRYLYNWRCNDKSNFICELKLEELKSSQLNFQ
jgi:hypothetical protein